MPVRVMVWNIQFFSEENFSNKTTASQLSGQHIVDAVKSINPDILIVIEVRSGGSNGVGSLISDTGGAKGVRKLKTKLGAGWHVVPPQVLNAQQAYYQVTQAKYFEGIGVFFRDAQLDFIGPQLWTATGPKPRNLAAPPAGIQAYGGTWAGMLPHTVPAGCGFQGHYQDEFAGQSIFYGGTGHPLQFPAQWGRAPFYTAFWDRTANRVIKTLAVHLPPSGYWAGQAMKQVGKINLEAAIPSDSVAQDTAGAMLVLGDFNLNQNNPNHTDSFNEGYLDDYTQSIVHGGSERSTLIRRAVVRTTAPYLHTTAAGKGGWWKKEKSTGYYMALDNILQQYYGPAAGVGVRGAIVDWVLRSPGFAPRTNAYMSTSFGLIGNDATFVQAANYGKIRSASDHLGMYIDV